MDAGRSGPFRASAGRTESGDPLRTGRGAPRRLLSSPPAPSERSGGPSQAVKQEQAALPIPAESDPERVRPACLHRRRSAELHPLSKMPSAQICPP